MFRSLAIEGAVPLSVLPPVVIYSQGQGVVARKVVWAVCAGDGIMSHAQGGDDDVLRMVGDLASCAARALVAAGVSREGAESRVLTAIRLALRENPENPGGDAGGDSPQAQA
ncbi:MAG: hypothetical protein AB1816_02760 [Bacillota bacterium]